MCGIAGILTPGGADPELLNDQLKRLAVSLRHRGPDAVGTWANQSGTAALVHTRLSILDLTSDANQPMAAEAGALQIVFNGEIYNFRELREELSRDGIVFRTQSDTEVLLQLYVKHGTAMLDRLRGMYAFAIWDQRKNRCFLARDPLGIKPLYYSVAGGRLAFASELKALQATNLTSNELDSGALLLYFQMGSVPEPHTLLRDCHCLEAGHYLMWKDGRFIKKRHTKASAYQHDESFSAVTCRKHVRESLLQAVEAHFVSDVPVGVFLSGGIDSTAIVALAKVLGRNNLETFSVSVDDRELDEGPVAQRTASHFNTRHHNTELDANGADAAFSGYLESIDQPTIDGFNTYLVSMAASRQGMKVVLSGLGGDEVFGGYKSFEQVPKLAAVGKAMRFLPGIRHSLGWLAETLPGDSRVRRIGSFFRSPGTLFDAWQCFRATFSAQDARRIAASYLGCSPADLPTLPLPKIEVEDQRSAVGDCELRFYMRNQLLKDSDVMSMAHSLELRVPFVDHRLHQQLDRLPPSLRLRPGKAALLDAVPEIPDWVAQRPKRGFVFPFESWLKQHWTGPFAEATSRLRLRSPTWYQRWAVFVLDAWLRRHGVR